ncbi:hypothetical protein ACROYT_G042246 [Oculina patagonica]
MERKILSLAIKCPSESCEWTGELRDKENHLTSCPFKLVSCPYENCKAIVARRDIEEHVTSTCKWRIVQCGHCDEAHAKCLEKEHMGKCKKLPVDCPDGCGTISDHLREDCPLTEISCPYYEMGCNKKIQRILLESHLESAARVHLDFACVKLHRTQKEFKETTRKLEERVDTLQKQLEDKVDEKVCALQKKLEEKVGAVKADLTSKIDINNYVLDFRIDREISEIRRNQSDQKKQSTSFIWKISGIYRILREATRNTSVKSEPFFTEPNGYKLRVLMKPNGDLSRSGKTGYVSFFLVIMRGEYDAILPWPFERTVTFRLIDQQEDPDYKEDVIMELSEEDNHAFLRPSKEENDGYGFPKFICHDKIRRRRYIVDDTAFLEVQVSPTS